MPCAMAQIQQEGVLRALQLPVLFHPYLLLTVFRILREAAPGPQEQLEGHPDSHGGRMWRELGSNIALDSTREEDILP